MDVGVIHLRGEMAEFYVLISSSGTRVDSALNAKLYYNGALYADLTCLVQHVTTGLYRIPYNIPLNASPGSYALVVDSVYCGVDGTDLNKFPA